MAGLAIICLKLSFQSRFCDFIEILKKDEIWTGEIIHTTKYGDKITVETRQQLIKDPSGKKIIIETNRDITERKKSEKALKESEEKYRSLFENLNSAAVLIEPIFDGDGRLVDLHYLMVNPQVKKHLNKTPEEMVGHLYSEVFHYNKENSVFDIYEKVIYSGEPFKGEVFLPALKKYFEIAVYRPVPGRLALVLSIFLTVNWRLSARRR